VTAENGPLPPDTRINVRYGGNQDGEPYALGVSREAQAVFCKTTSSASGGDAAAGGAGGGSSAPSDGVQALRCRLYTQGPARLDVTATGYQPIEDLPLSLDGESRCEVPFDVVLMLEKPDAGT